MYAPRRFNRGSVSVHNGDKQEIEFFRNSWLEIGGLEISLANSVAQDYSGISEENEKYLRNLKFTTMHLPWKNMEYSRKENAEIMRLSKIYNDLNCRVAVIHPDCVKNIEDYEILQNLFPGLSVENLTYRTGRVGSSIESIKKITDKYDNICVVLDFAHCLGAPDSFESYEKAFGEKIREIHMSAPEKEGEHILHMLMHKTETFPKIAKRDVLLILEGRVIGKEELEKEINFAKQL